MKVTDWLAIFDGVLITLLGFYFVDGIRDGIKQKKKRKQMENEEMIEKNFFGNKFDSRNDFPRD